MQQRYIRLPKSYVDSQRALGVLLPDALPVQGEWNEDETAPFADALAVPLDGEDSVFADLAGAAVRADAASGAMYDDPYEPEEEALDGEDAEDSGADDEKDASDEDAAPTQKHGAGAGVRSAKKRRGPRRWLRRAVAACCALAAAGAAALGVYLSRATANDFLWLDLEQLPHRDATVLYAQNAATGEWEEYARLESTQQKIWVDLEDIPLDMQHAFVAVEDKDFYKHSGVSWHRTIFAVLNELKRAVTGTYFGGDDGMKQGASTIDQQLIKNLTLDDDGSGLDGYLRKVREIWRALRLDAKYDKDVILEAYLNVISFTGNTAGVGAESIKLFNKPVSELSLAQCASIAAITKNPSRYDPVTHPENNIARRNYILQEMWQQGYITEEEYLAASAEPLGLSAGVVNVPETPTTSWFTDQVIEDVSDALGEKYGLDRSETTHLLYNGGLRIYTTVDADLQADMEQVMRYGGYFQRPGIPGTDYVYNEDGTRVTDENGDYVTQEVTEYPQAAMVTVDYEGRLRAVVGSLDDKTVSRAFNRGTDALRQVGSTMKPIGPYAVALQKDKIHWSTPFLDDAVELVTDEETGETTPWPANVTEVYTKENILVADAMAESVNTVAVRVGQTVGVGAIYNFVTDKLHITSFTADDRDYGPMVLGSSTYGVTPYELAGAYMIFGNGGVYTTLHSYESVQTGTGTEILVPQVESQQVIDSDTAWIMNRLLLGVMQGAGTGAGYSVPGEMESVGKTGTSSDNRDFWFVGLTPYYVTATWYGYDSGAALNVYNGTHAPARAWRAVMQRAQDGLAAKQFVQDESVVTAAYCTETGGLATDACPHTATGYYKHDALPAPCTQHAG